MWQSRNGAVNGAKRIPGSPSAGPDSRMWIPEPILWTGRETLWFDKAEKN